MNPPVNFPPEELTHAKAEDLAYTAVYEGAREGRVAPGWYLALVLPGHRRLLPDHLRPL